MLEKKDRVIVGVSGGADFPYACFLCLQSFGMNDKKAEMERWKLRRCMYIMASRGDSADADERYVRKICDGLERPACCLS